MDAPIEYADQPPGTHAGGICAACGQLIDRGETRVQATIRMAAGTAAAFLHRHCRFDGRWLPSPRDERRE